MDRTVPRIALGVALVACALVSGGCSGESRADVTGRVTYKMLDLYVAERVKALTKGKQSPVTQAPGGVNDFPLASVK